MMSRISQILGACVVFVASCSTAHAAQASPAAGFIAKLFSGEAATAKVMIDGSVGLSRPLPAFPGQYSIDGAVFVETIRNCDVERVRSTVSTGAESKSFEVIWNCSGANWKAQISDMGQSVTISGFGGMVFAPPAPPMPNTQSGKQ